MRIIALCLVILLMLTACGVNTNEENGESVTVGNSSSESVTVGGHVHTPTVIEGLEPACNELGLTSGEKCLECGEILLAQIPLSATGHNMITKGNGQVCCSVCNLPAPKMYEAVLEIGTIGATTGEPGANKTRLRTGEFIPIGSFDTITVEKGYKVTWFTYDAEKNYMGNGSNKYPAMPTGGVWLPDGQGISAEEILEWNKNVKYLKFAICKTNGTDIAFDSDVAAVKIYSSGYEIPAPEIFTAEYKGQSLGTTNTVTATKIASVKGLQDGAVCGGYFFAFSGSGLCRVYSTSDYNQIAEFTLDKVNKFKPHSNSVCFGTLKYDENDEFPLLYCNVYNNYGKDNDDMMGACGVYRIVREGNTFKSTLVQVIKVGFTNDTKLWSSSGGDVRPYGNFVIDTDRSKLIVFTMRDGDSSTRFFEFDIPSLKDGKYDSSIGVKKVVLTEDGITEKFKVSYFRYLQGCTYYDGKVYSLEGFTDSEKNPASLKIVDLGKKKLLTEVKLYEMGLTVEPEAAYVIDGELYYADVSGNVYKFTFH